MTRAIMTFEIGQLTLNRAAPVSASAAVANFKRPEEAVPARAVDRSDVIPASPPPEALAAVDFAWERGKQLADDNRELHFARDQLSGRMIIQVRTLDGEVLRTIPPAKALDVMSGGGL